MHILTGFLIFSRYSICKIVKGVRKVSSSGFEMRPSYISESYWCQCNGISPSFIALTREISLTAKSGANIT